MAINPTRRRCLGAALAVAAGYRARFASSQPLGEDVEPIPLTEDYLAEVFESDAEPWYAAQPPPKIKPWRELSPRPEPAWAADDHSIDFRHLGALYSNDAFALTSGTMALLCLANGFPVAGSSERVLFGLRACQLAQDPPDNPVPRLEMMEARPNHKDRRCVIGVWDRAAGTLWATDASTVPGVNYMYEYSQGGSACNMLPTGIHRYQVGPHGRKWPRARQPGAFRQIDAVCVLRSRDDLTLAVPGDSWDPSFGYVVADNIHAAVLDRATQPPFFSSAGCQVVPGDYSADRKVPTGRWALFREYAGLLRRPQFKAGSETETTDDGRRFFYILLTGREARLAASGQNEAELRRGRFGSRGGAVPALRERLGLQAGDRFDQRVMDQLIRFQLERFGIADGVVGPATAKELGITL